MMPFVMVPVPEEYVTEVMQLVVDMTKQQGATDHDAASDDDHESPAAPSAPGTS
jgi:hypothetical protein